MPSIMLGLLGAIPNIIGAVQGIAGAAKGAKAAKGGDDEGGAKANAKANAGEAPAKKDAAVDKQETIDRFIKMLDSPNVKSLQDIRGVRDRVMDQVQKNGLGGEDADNAKKKLDQAILKKLGIAKPGPGGSVQVELTPQVKQMLDTLGMKPDQVNDAGQEPQLNAAPQGAAQPGAAAANPAP